MKKKSVAVVIISNGPGELTTWVKPVINNLKKEILTLKFKKRIHSGRTPGNMPTDPILVSETHAR